MSSSTTNASLILNSFELQIPDSSTSDCTVVTSLNHWYAWRAVLRVSLNLRTTQSAKYSWKLPVWVILVFQVCKIPRWQSNTALLGKRQPFYQLERVGEREVSLVWRSDNPVGKTLRLFDLARASQIYRISTSGNGEQLPRHIIIISYHQLYSLQLVQK